MIKINKADIPIKKPQNAPPIMPVPTRCIAGFVLILPSGLQIIPKKSSLLSLSDFFNNSSPIQKTTTYKYPKTFFIVKIFSF